MNRLKQILCVISSVGFILTALLSSVDVFAFQRSFFKNQYHQLQTAEEMGMSETDLMKATDVLLDYLKDERDDIQVMVKVHSETVPMFNKRETAHMVDVKNLYQNAMLVRNVSLVCMIVSLVLLLVYFRKEMMFSLCYRYMQSAIFSIVVVGALGLFILADFNTFWTNFHHVFFSNDLWLLNPLTDRMIQMFPEPFFNAMVIRIVMAFIFVFVGALFLAVLYMRTQLKRKENEHA